jgi:hypothetical protein
MHANPASRATYREGAMSLDVYLNVLEPVAKSSGIFIRENGQKVEISREEWDRRNPGQEPVAMLQDDITTEVYTANVTHNLGKMAREAGIYTQLWRPDEIGVTKARQLIEPLENGLKLLKAEPERFKALNPENGWGTYDGFVSFVEAYLNACRQWPESDVSVWR